MKDLTNALRAFLVLALLTAFFFIALQFRPTVAFNMSVAEAPVAAKPTGQPYPLPQLDFLSTPAEPSSNPYPAPGRYSEMRQTVDCSKVDTWVEYANEEAGFSFKYPAESEMIKSVDNNGYTSITLILKPYCYAANWWGPMTMTIAVLDNLTKLTVEDFVVKQHTFDASTDVSALSQDLANNSETVSVARVRALRVDGKMTKEVPHVYIPCGDHVIFVGLTETTNMPPFEPACPATLDLYNKILASVRFLHQ